jgi:hypothetical protein
MNVGHSAETNGMGGFCLGNCPDNLYVDLQSRVCCGHWRDSEALWDTEMKPWICLNAKSEYGIMRMRW